MKKMEYVENFYSKEDADAMFEFLKAQPHKRMMNKQSGNKYPLRRINYPGYSVRPNETRPTSKYGGTALVQDFADAPPEMLDLAARLSKYSGKEINYLSAIGYEDENDHINPHFHQEDVTLSDQSVYVVSFGQPREVRYGMRDLNAKKKFTYLGKRESFIAAHGSLYVLPHEANATMLHEIPDQDYPCGLRIAINAKALPTGPQVYSCHAGSKHPVDAVYVGKKVTRGGVNFPRTPYGNHGGLKGEDYRRHIEECMKFPQFRELIEKLRGKDLLCWCTGEDRKNCHAKVLLEVANRPLLSQV